MPQPLFNPTPTILDGIPLVQARNFTPADRDAVGLLVLHSMESQEKPGTAMRVAEWFSGTAAPKASAHYCVDDRLIVRCVRDKDVAWHAPGANLRGIGIEHAGRAAQTASDWADGYSMAMLERSILLAAELCKRWDIPAWIVDINGLRRGERGITTHNLVSMAFHKSTHTDPGPNFPLLWYVRRVQLELGGLA